jgi:hypothetical protein
LSSGTYPVYVAADAETTAQVHVDWAPAEDMQGELCEDAIPLEPSAAPVLIRLPGYRLDAPSKCDPEVGDAFLRFNLPQAADVTIVAEAQNDWATPVVALWDAGCALERTCRQSQPGRLFVRNLPAGDYRVQVGGSAPDDISVRLETAPVSPAPPGEGCDDAQPLTLGVETVVDLSEHEDAVYPRCLVGAPDATFEFDLTQTSDVALIGRFSDGDEGAVSLANDTCNANRACSEGQGTQRAMSYAVAAGTHRAVIESALGDPVGLSWFSRPASAVVNVPFADNCDALVSIPEDGGRFVGNTSNAFPDFVAGCDVGGQSEGGAPDQILELSLSKPRRVILDMQGSSYETLLSVRQGASCPGSELPRACAPGYRASRSYLDLDLQAGDYFVQIDGYNGAAGPWKLDVFTAPLSP